MLIMTRGVTDKINNIKDRYFSDLTFIGIPLFLTEKRLLKKLNITVCRKLPNPTFCIMHRNYAEYIVGDGVPDVPKITFSTASSDIV